MYLSVHVISTPILAANNRGETQGTINTLQKVETDLDSRTVLSGYAIKYAIREHMAAMGAKMWRLSGAQNPSGFVYQKGDGSVVDAMAKAIPASPELFDDTLAFGYMIAPSGSKDKYAGTRSACVDVTPALSTTSWKGDMAFIRGLKAESKEEGKAPDLAPNNCERHLTRYQYTLTANLDGIKPRPTTISYILNAMKGLKVGGNHACNASEVIPEFVAWRFHKEPGTGGLYLCDLNYDPNMTVLGDAIRARLDSLGIDNAGFAGAGCEMTIADAISSMTEDAVMYIKGA